MIDWNKPVQTVMGERVTMLALDVPELSPRGFIGIIYHNENHYSKASVCAWDYRGKILIRSSQRDLMNVPDCCFCCKCKQNKE